MSVSSRVIRHYCNNIKLDNKTLTLIIFSFFCFVDVRKELPVIIINENKEKLLSDSFGNQWMSDLNDRLEYEF